MLIALNFPKKGQCVGIVYPSDAISVDYIIKTNRKLSDNIHVIIIKNNSSEIALVMLVFLLCGRAVSLKVSAKR